MSHDLTDTADLASNAVKSFGPVENQTSLYSRSGLNNNNNNNNNNKLQMSCRPEAVVIIHVHEYEIRI